MMNQIQEDESNLDELKKQIESAKHHTKGEIKKVENNVRRIKLALSNMEDKEKYLMQEMNIQSENEKKLITNSTGPNNINSSFLDEEIYEKIIALYAKCMDSPPDLSRDVTDFLNTIELQLLKVIKANDGLAAKYKNTYDAKFKEVEKSRKKKRKDEDKIRKNQEDQIKNNANMRKMNQRNSSIVFKGKPPVFRAMKKKLPKKTNKSKESQADFFFNRYVGKFTPQKAED